MDYCCDCYPQENGVDRVGVQSLKRPTGMALVPMPRLMT